MAPTFGLNQVDLWTWGPTYRRDWVSTLPKTHPGSAMGKGRLVTLLNFDRKDKETEVSWRAG